MKIASYHIRWCNRIPIWNFGFAQYDKFNLTHWLCGFLSYSFALFCCYWFIYYYLNLIWQRERDWRHNHNWAQRQTICSAYCRESSHSGICLRVATVSIDDNTNITKETNLSCVIRKYNWSGRVWLQIRRIANARQVSPKWLTVNNVMIDASIDCHMNSHCFFAICVLHMFAIRAQACQIGWKVYFCHIVCT